MNKHQRIIGESLLIQNSKNSCLKQVVRALIETPDNNHIFGENSINSQNISKCPRIGMKTGVGYDLCKNICKQYYHAETAAIHQAKLLNIPMKNSVLYLTGHTFCCDECLKACKNEGISKIIIFDNNLNIVRDYFL